MKKHQLTLFKKLFAAAGLVTCAGSALAQAQYQPYSYQFYQKLSDSVYSTRNKFHSSIKPYIIADPVIQPRYKALMELGVDTSVKHSWVHRKLFNEHLIDIKNDEYTFFADYLPDLTIGRDISDSRTTWLNTRGYQIGGTIGKNFYFYTSGFENQAVFANYFDTYVNQTSMVPGQAYNRNSITSKTKDWSYVTALLSYTANKYINIAAGYDKNFIGDGYRSMLLSDFGSPYSFFRITATVGDVKYLVMWNYMTDRNAPVISSQLGLQKKWGVFHYLDWSVTNRLSLGFFDSIIWADNDPQGNKRGFDFSYGHPIIFLRPVEAANGSPDNALIGFNGKYKLTDKVIVYGQFALDEFEAKNFFSGKGSSRNKFGWQVGLRGTNIFNIAKLNYLLEYNEAKPYTYSQTSSVIGYSHNNESLAHPYGANFKEGLGMLNYSYKRFDLSGQLTYSRYGLDVNGTNWGKNILLDYRTQERYAGPIEDTLPNSYYATEGNYVGQGLATNLYYAEAKAAYLLNAKYNLRIELGLLYRKETNAIYINNTKMVSIGLRSTFRNLYQDITGF
ncbi:gliding motility protein RemB [Mucilaginibacter daejeonensis]|uniref:gliding motility protein RemB n=1 Tax=Mucilaginibacter daejeonensis TaxID=398049 RepID=UPI001D1710FB|nr:gliding motility protein RemB [Mucilaginibacter daejeonensis]UEG54954.1 gliding motility protein RemB [Mucilaginibacter daejeonensis]